MLDFLLTLGATFSATDTTKTLNISDGWRFPGSDLVEMVMAELVIPNFTNAVTLTIDIKTPSGTVVFTKGSLAKNTQHPLPQDGQVRSILLEKYSTVVLTLSGAPGTGGDTVLFKAYVERENR